MAPDETPQAITTTQVATTDLNVVEKNESPPVQPLYGETGPAPEGAVTVPDPGPETAKEINEGVGVEGEVVVWDARYSARNFIGRFVLAGLLTLGWLVMGAYTLSLHRPHDGWKVVTVILGAILAVFLLRLAYQYLMAHFGHHYCLTNRRLFVSTGVFRRRRDQMELLKVQDVYTKQHLLQRWLRVGTVAVVSSDKSFPMAYLTGVNDPLQVQDLIWHQVRTERDVRSVKVDQV